MKQKALIYCRVSSQRQVAEGHGLESQEKLCRNYAKSKDYLVEKVFPEEGIMGELFDRPKMKELLEYLDEHIDNKYIIIFDDLKRFSRDVAVHFKLKSEIYGRGGRVESPNFKFEDTAEGKFVETIIVATGELEKNQNKRQVKQKMKARLENGYWPFCMPPGLINEKNEIKGKVLVSREPLASIYKEAIEKYRDNVLNTLEEIKNFILKKYKENNINKTISFNGVKNILTEELYCGYIEYKPWGIPFKKGQHKGFISLETYKIVQIKLEGKAKPRLRKDYNDDFPLRPFVLCGACNKPLTASWNKGRINRYPNYWCKNKACQYCYKTISRGLIEGEFEDLLVTVKPRDEILSLTREIMIDLWTDKKAQLLNQNAHIYKTLEGIDGEISNLAKRLGKITIDSVFNVCEKQISDLENQKKEILKEIVKPEVYTTEKFGTASEKVFLILKQPITIWRNENLEIKRTILYMYFEEAPVYFYKKGFGTANLSLPIKLMNEAKNPKNHLVEMPGVEPGSKETLLKKFSER
jgi:DNA invertase Pin-like site-specific DNA recombinase